MKFPKAMLMVAALSTFAGGAIAQETGTLKKMVHRRKPWSLGERLRIT
ncbi:amino acid ABC transporter substrate-binding protein [Burkholderia mallei]|nr:glutamate/aspartate periplasmic binding protein [Burkholderia mallei SAVP1]EEP88319.1 conserved domain protein [Burkholderia mallei GB8 horse 4]RPA05825.1 amino acid ABC transporter substrate-binding protein [Burkholderia mallei]RPA16363.1 amino acid ABC transporter substrate-binding protein [Burkholderia mallei]RPA54657.1 amino acid ABC transporter substrate-binding protein [Burkholderia mallei]